MSTHDLKGRLQCMSMHNHKCKNYGLNSKNNSQI